MPKRSTPFQAIVHLVRQHLAEPGVTVTESKMLRDAALGVEREVDIVVEGALDGEPMVISIEVIEQGRPATLKWVEEMLRKHEHLPTNRLLLVSKSGFVRNALKAVNNEAGRVQALTPEVVEVNGQPVVRRFLVDTIDFRVTNCQAVLRVGSEIGGAIAAPNVDVYSIDGVRLGSMMTLVQELLNLDEIRRRQLREVYRHPNRRELKSADLEVRVQQLGYHVLTLQGERHLIRRLVVYGNLALVQTEVPLVFARLGGRVYGAAEATIAGSTTVWVTTNDWEKGTAKVSSRVMATRNSARYAAPASPVTFPGLLDLFRVGKADATQMDG